jgi:hypothetical protein
VGLRASRFGVSGSRFKRRFKVRVVGLNPLTSHVTTDEVRVGGGMEGVGEAGVAPRTPMAAPNPHGGPQPTNRRPVPACLPNACQMCAAGSSPYARMQPHLPPSTPLAYVFILNNQQCTVEPRCLHAHRPNLFLINPRRKNISFENQQCAAPMPACRPRCATGSSPPTAATRSPSS